MISIGGLKKTFQRQKVLDGLNLEIRKGERIALVGQNGSGKTTLIRCILGLYQYSGNITVNGNSTRSRRIEVLKETAFVPQHPPGMRMTVRDYINTVQKLTGCEPAKISEIAEKMELSIAANAGKPFVSLSGGMKQKILIATALARRPALLIMDEPTANLDPRSRAKFFEELHKLPAETSMILSSHRLDEVAGLVTRLIELDHGEVVVDDLVQTAMPDRLEYLDCLVVFSRSLPSAIDALTSWNFKPAGGKGPFGWTGRINALERFRFLSMLSRWAGSLEKLELDRRTEGPE